MKTSSLVTVILISIFSVASAMKRILGQTEDKRPKKFPKVAEIAKQDDFPPLPVELLMEIFSHVINDLGMKRVFKDPIKNYCLVSRSWNSQLRSTEFKNFLAEQPKYALLQTKRHFDISSPFLVRLLHTAAPLIDINAAIKLLLRAQSGDEIRKLSKLPVFQSRISLNALNMHLKYAIRNGYLAQIIPYTENNLCKYNARLAIRRNLHGLGLGLNQHFALTKNLALDLVKMLFLEDLYKPDKFSGFYRFTCRLIYHSFQWCHFDHENHLLDALRGLILPLSGLEALFVTTIRYLFKASFIGNREFSHFINPDFSLDQEYLENAAIPILPILQRIHQGEIDEFPAKDILLAKKIIKRKIGHPLCVSDRNLIEARKKVILDDDSIDDSIKRLVRSSI